MTTIELSLNIAISIIAGAGSGFAVFKFLGKKWVENWFAKDLKFTAVRRNFTRAIAARKTGPEHY